MEAKTKASPKFRHVSREDSWALKLGALYLGECVDEERRPLGSLSPLISGINVVSTDHRRSSSRSLPRDTSVCADRSISRRSSVLTTLCESVMTALNKLVFSNRTRGNNYARRYIKFYWYLGGRMINLLEREMQDVATKRHAWSIVYFCGLSLDF